MRDELKEYGSYFIGLAIIIYVGLSIFQKDKSILDNISTTTTITIMIAGVYSKWLWKFNPFDKTPKVYGKYKMTFLSTYDKLKRTMDVIIKQDLFSNRIYIKTKESKSESKTSSIITKKDSHELVYTYQNIPNKSEREHSEIHFGTCIFNIENNRIVSGRYYTDRQTTGDIINIRKVKKKS